MSANAIQFYNVKVWKNEVPEEIHTTPDALKLKDACQQFESILWADIWKKAKTDARRMSEGNEQSRPWKQLEDLSIEMASVEISKSGGAGLWKVLYDQLIGQVASQRESSAETETAEACFRP